MEVDPPEIPDPGIVEVIANQTTANKADDLSDSISDLEIRTRVAILRKQKEMAELKAELERLECKKTGGFVDEYNQISSDEHACQLSLECSKRV